MARSAFILGLITIVMATATSAVEAQGLIWSLPEDGTLVRYKGVYTQTVRRPESTEGDLTLTWDRIVEVRSVGKTEAEYQEKATPCRWIEIKIETGKSPEGVLDAGPGGIRMYKLLVPETEVRGTNTEPVRADRSIFASHVPIVRGYRKIGDEQTVELETSIFQLYPIASLLRHYPDLNQGEQGTTSVLAGEFQTTSYSGSVTMETQVYRSTNTGTFQRAETMPFGIVSWKARTLIEEKGSTDPRSEFRETSIIEEDMQVIAIEQNAESELLVN